MIHYHGTPCGGKREEVARFLTGRHALVPWPRPEDIATVAEVCQSFCLDNGAFSIWRQGGSADWKRYYDWVAEWYRHPAFDFALIPDVIAGTEEENDLLIEDWPHGSAGVPVWHMHESIDRLKRLLKQWRITALGSSGKWPNPGTKSWWSRMDEVMDAVCDEHGRPEGKLHGLRMLDPAIFTKLPLSSADSTNAVQNSSAKNRFGMYAAPNSGTRMHVIAERIEIHQSAAIWLRSKQLDLFDLSVT